MGGGGGQQQLKLGSCRVVVVFERCLMGRSTVAEGCGRKNSSTYRHCLAAHTRTQATYSYYLGGQAPVAKGNTLARRAQLPPEILAVRLRLRSCGSICQPARLLSGRRVCVGGAPSREKVY